jgi:hypothetical protein
MSKEDLEIIFNKKDFSSVTFVKFSDLIPVSLIKEKLFLFNKNAKFSNFTYDALNDEKEIVMYIYNYILSIKEEDCQVFLLCGQEELIINKVVCRMIETSIITKEVSIIEIEYFEEEIWYPRCSYTDEILSFDREDAYIEPEMIGVKAVAINKKGKIVEEPFFEKAYNNCTYLNEYDYSTKKYQKRISQRDSFDHALIGIKA